MICLWSTTGECCSSLRSSASGNEASLRELFEVGVGVQASIGILYWLWDC